MCNEHITWQILCEVEARIFGTRLCVRSAKIMSSSETRGAFKVSNPSEGPQLSATQLKFMKLIESQNLERIAKLERIRKRNTLTGWGLAAVVVGIYTFSMFAVKQERFLDDFDEPEKVIDTKK